jgi:hypothetical protein
MFNKLRIICEDGIHYVYISSTHNGMHIAKIIEFTVFRLGYRESGCKPESWDSSVNITTSLKVG